MVPSISPDDPTPEMMAGVARIPRIVMGSRSSHIPTPTEIALSSFNANWSATYAKCLVYCETSYPGSPLMLQYRYDS